jgi:hypothetical protein
MGCFWGLAHPRVNASMGAQSRSKINCSSSSEYLYRGGILYAILMNRRRQYNTVWHSQAAWHPVSAVLNAVARGWYWATPREKSEFPGLYHLGQLPHICHGDRVALHCNGGNGIAAAAAAAASRRP